MLFQELAEEAQKGIEKVVLAKFSDGMNDYETKEALAGSRVVIMENYISDTPGFVGDIYLLVFGGGPETALVISHYQTTHKGVYKEEWEIVFIIL